MARLFSAWIWFSVSLLIVIWLPLLVFVRLFDRTETRYRTGRVFRILGLAISRINPNWKITIEGFEGINDRTPYIVVCNHLSNADIPLISNLPWEMKWVAKKELFDLPVVGTMMKFAGDISVDRAKKNKKEELFEQCRFYLDRYCSVMFFPEGTRSRSGKLGKFAPGAFELAVQENIPILPLVIDGTQDCLPKKTWIFKREVYINLKVLEPVIPGKDGPDRSIDLMHSVRGQISAQLAEWRGVDTSEVDAAVTDQKSSVG